MDLALPAAVCIYCNTQAVSLLVCAQCEMVGYCSTGCMRKYDRKHRGRCKLIAKMRKQTEEISEDMTNLKTGYYALDLDLDYGSSSQFYTWVEDVHREAVCQIEYHLEEICKKRLHRLTVEKLLRWRMCDLKAFVFDGTTDFNYKKVGCRGMTEPIYIQECMNNFCALGRFQAALDWVSHWRRKELLEMKGGEILVKHFKRWVDGDYVREDITEKFDFLRFICNEGSHVEELNISYNLVIIKLFVIANMKNHLHKRERFLAFMLGTHPRLGSDSQVMMLAGMTPAVRLIAKYCDISCNPLGIQSSTISASSLDQNLSQLDELLRKIHYTNPHALFSMIGDYSLRKLDFHSEEEFKALPGVEAGWMAGEWSRKILERLQDTERDMFVEMAKKVINTPVGDDLSPDSEKCKHLEFLCPYLRLI